MTHLLLLILSLVLFVGMVIYLALEPNSRKKITGIAFFITVVGGTFFYSCYYVDEAIKNGENALLSILPTLIAVGRMFVGVNGPFDGVVGSVISSYGFSKDVSTFFYWLVHFLAYYSMASAAILALGEGVIQRIRFWLNMIRDIELIYGVNDTSLGIGRNLAEKKGTQVIFVGKAREDQRQAIKRMKGIILDEKWAENPGKKLLKMLSVKPGRGKLTLSALSEDISANLSFSLALRDSLKERGIKPAQTALVLLGQEELDGATLQAKGSYYGYGSVKVFECAELLARLLMQKYPVCNAVEFDEVGKATNNLNVLLLGFGKTGQEVLRKIIASGQFEGSTMHVQVFDPACDTHGGFFRERYKTMLAQYDIEFVSSTAQSAAVYGYVRTHAKDINYVVVAVGSDKEGREIALELEALLKKAGKALPIYRCSRTGIVCHRADGDTESYSLEDAEYIYGGYMDELAKKINHHYCGDKGSIEGNWQNCDYYSRMSSRASADCLSALFKRLGVKNKSDLTGEVFENISKTEHLRWCAFHYSMEFKPMDREEWDMRALKYKKDFEKWSETGEGDKPRFKAGKDMAQRLHACLVTWDELDELSDRENSFRSQLGETETIDYKEKDREAVETVLEVITETSKKVKET